MYELKKNGKVFTSKSVGTGPSSYGKRILLAHGLTKIEKQWLRELNLLDPELFFFLVLAHPVYKM